MKNLKSTTLSSVILLACFATGLAAGIVRGLEINIPTWIWIILIIGLFIVSMAYWHIIDETAKEAHKFSWYWGSSIGICLVIGLYFANFSGMNSIHMFAWLIPEQPSADDIFFTGTIAAIFTQCICYAIVWILWWLRMR